MCAWSFMCLSTSLLTVSPSLLLLLHVTLARLCTFNSTLYNTVHRASLIFLYVLVWLRISCVFVLLQQRACLYLEMAQSYFFFFSTNPDEKTLRMSWSRYHTIFCCLKTAKLLNMGHLCYFKISYLKHNFHQTYWCCIYTSISVKDKYHQNLSSLLYVKVHSLKWERLLLFNSIVNLKNC